MKKNRIKNLQLNSHIVTLVIVFVLSVLFTGLVVGRAVNNDNKTIMNLVGIKTDALPVESSQQDEETEMTVEVLEGLKGQNFDREFIAHMIHHHQDAVDSAKLVSTNSQRPELAKWAENMIVTQENEIKELKKWQVDWRLIDPTSNAHYH